MSLRAFIAPAPAPLVGSEVTLCAEESHYLIRVRRAKVGSACELLDRQGQAFSALVSHADPRACVLSIQSTLADLIELPRMELYLGMPDTAALLASLSRATELGASRILLLRTAYSQGRMPSSTRIARCLDAAMRQSGRRQRPEIHGPVDFQQGIHSPFAGCSWLACPDRSTERPPQPGSEQSQRIAIGPEGGFSKAEVEQLHGAGFAPLWLGPYILRSEVAVTAGLSHLLAHLEP